MKIRFIQTMSTTREVFHTGHDYDLPNDDALRYIMEGAARKAAEPSDAPAVPEDAHRGLLKPGEKIGVTAGLPNAVPVDPPKPDPKNNPAGFLHHGPGGGSAMPEPHPGFNTTQPDARTSPPSDAPQIVATNKPAPYAPAATVLQPAAVAKPAVAAAPATTVSVK